MAYLGQSIETQKHHRHSQLTDASFFSFPMYAPKLSVLKTPATKTIAKAARLSRGELLFIMANPLLN